jgi:hypothetical protein
MKPRAAKRAAVVRAQQAQRDKLPLLAPLIAEQQPGANAEMTRRVGWWPKLQQHDRDRRAHDWRRARAARRHGDNLRRVLVQLWRGCPYPADPVTLLDLLHSVDTGRINFRAPAMEPPSHADPAGRTGRGGGSRGRGGRGFL